MRHHGTDLSCPDRTPTSSKLLSNLTFIPPSLREERVDIGLYTPARVIQLPLPQFNPFWFKTMQNDVETFINRCQICTVSKPSWQLLAGLLQPFPIPQRHWSYIVIDFVTNLPHSQGTPHNYILQCVPFLWSSRGHYVGLWPAMHIQSLVCIL